MSSVSDLSRQLTCHCAGACRPFSRNGSVCPKYDISLFVIMNGYNISRRIRSTYINFTTYDTLTIVLKMSCSQFIIGIVILVIII